MRDLQDEGRTLPGDSLIFSVIPGYQFAPPATRSQERSLVRLCEGSGQQPDNPHDNDEDQQQQAQQFQLFGCPPGGQFIAGPW